MNFQKRPEGGTGGARSCTEPQAEEASTARTHLLERGGERPLYRGLGQGWFQAVGGYAWIKRLREGSSPVRAETPIGGSGRPGRPSRARPRRGAPAGRKCGAGLAAVTRLPWRPCDGAVSGGTFSAGIFLGARMRFSRHLAGQAAIYGIALTWWIGLTVVGLVRTFGG